MNRTYHVACIHHSETEEEEKAKHTECMCHDQSVPIQRSFEEAFEVCKSSLS